MYYVLLFAVVTPLSLSVGTNCTIANQEYVCGALVCNASTNQCISCSSDSQCMNRNHKCDNGVCSLKPLVDTINGAFWIAPLGAIILLSAIGLVAGVGAGGINVPLLILLFSTSMSKCVAFAQAINLGQSIAGSLFRMAQHHPVYSNCGYGQRPLINYPYLTLMLPFIIVGSILGALFARTTPDWFKVIIIFIVFTFLLIKGFINTFKIYKRDSHLKTEMDNPSLSTDKIHLHISNYIPPHIQVPKYYLFELVMCIVMFVILVIGSLLRTYIFKCGSAPFFIAVAIPIALLIVCFIVVRNRYANKQREMGTKIANPVIPFAWSIYSSVIYPIIAMLAGIMASIVGTGAGHIITAILFETGLEPGETAATGIICMLQNNLASVLIFLISGLLPYDYCLFFMLIGTIGSIAGKYLLLNPIKQHNWNFLVFVCWCFIILGSLIAMSTWGIIKTVNAIKHRESLGFKSICSMH